MSESLGLQSEALLKGVFTRDESAATGVRSANVDPVPGFQRMLENTLDGELDFSPPDKDEAEVLASVQGASELMSGISGLKPDAVLNPSEYSGIGDGIEVAGSLESQAFDGKNQAESSASGESELFSSLQVNSNMTAEELNFTQLSHLKQSVSEVPGAVSTIESINTDNAVVGGIENNEERLRQLLLTEQNMPGFWHRIRDHFGDLNFHAGDSEVLEEELNGDLAAQLSDLIRAQFKPESNRANADVWVQQVWPLPHSQSIFNGGLRYDVPYNPERGTFEEPDYGSVDAWDDKFEAGWASVQAGDLSGSGIDQSSEGIPDNSDQASVNSNSNASESVAGGTALFDEMVKQVQINLERGDYRMTLNLYPEHLGRLNMKVSLQGDNLKARFLVENEAVQELMMSRLGELKESLSSRGMNVEKLEVAVLRNSDPIPTNLYDIRHSSERISERQGYDHPRVAYFNSEQAGLSNMWVV